MRRGGAANREARLRRAFGGARRVDFENPRHLRALHAIADVNLKLRARRDGFIAGGLQGADMQEGVARSVAQFDKAEAFIALEPFDDCIELECPEGAAGAISGPPEPHRRKKVWTGWDGANRKGTARHRQNHVSSVRENLYLCS